MTQNGFRHHVSQHWTWFYGWIYGEGYQITSSDQITSYTPRQYGLFRSEVGEDVLKNDFFENVRTYEEREEEKRLEEERQAEESRRLEEENRKLEEERQAEESRRLEEESRKLEEQQREQEKNTPAETSRAPASDTGSGLPVILLLVLLAAAAGVMAYVYRKGGIGKSTTRRL